VKEDPGLTIFRLGLPERGKSWICLERQAVRKEQEPRAIDKYLHEDNACENRWGTEWRVTQGSEGETKSNLLQIRLNWTVSAGNASIEGGREGKSFGAEKHR